MLHVAESPAATTRRPRRPLSTRARRAVLTVHIASSVGLLGDVAAVLAMNVRAATTDDPEFAGVTYQLLEMFSAMFGIPLSFIALGSGVLLGLGTKWGVLRHAWVAVKLGLLVSVIVVGALVLGPNTAAMRAGDGGSGTTLIIGAAYDVLALSLATGLSVFKPRPRLSARPRT